MAYDPKDPADVKIVTDAVAAALSDAEEAHEAEITGLKNKNSDLLGKLKKARTDGGSDNTAEIDRLEHELSDNQTKLRAVEGELRTVKRDLATVTTERDTATTALATETEFSRNTLVNSALTSALVEANVQPQFLDDVTASLSRGVTIKEVDGKRQAFANDKPLSEFVKEWSLGDKGKHYVAVPQNGGGNAQGSGNPQGGPKKIYEMTGAERAAAHAADPAGFDARVAAGENKAPPPAKP